MGRSDARLVLLVGLVVLTLIGTLYMPASWTVSNHASTTAMGMGHNTAPLPQDTYSHTPRATQAVSYNRIAAYGYAYKWWNGRNPHYNDFSSMGGDCANFVSQCLIAGGLSLHKGTDGGGYGVYPDKDRPSTNSYGTIPYCDYLDLHLRNYQNAVVTYVTDTNPYVPGNIEVGDVVIFGDKNGDKYKHAMIVVGVGNGDCTLAAHSSDVWGRSFSTEMSYFSCATFYHIPVSSAGYYHFRVDTGTLNVRVGAGKNSQGNYYQDIGDIHSGEEYVAFGYALDDQGRKWWHFWYDDRAAWCAAWYTTEVSTNTVFEVDVSQYLNVRDGPSTSYTIIGQTYDGMRYVAYAQSGDWYKFYYSGTSAYCHSGYTIIVEQGSSPQPDSQPQQRIDGIDVSHWQGSIDWNQVYNAGYRFAYCKATEGTGYTDPTFSGHMQNGKNAGMLMGAYHFARPTQHTAQAEAQYFVSVIQPYLTNGYLRPALDLEDGSSLGKSALSQWVHDFMNEVKTQTGIEPIIYCNANYASNYLDSSLTQYDLWIAHYTSASSPNTGVWPSWSFWQYSDSGNVPGINSGTTDLDYYNGDYNSLKANFEIGGTSPPPNQPPIANAGSDKTVVVGHSLTFDGTQSYDPDGSIVQYTWNFGDGSIAYGSITSHTYTSTGTYTVTLYVYDNNNAVGTDTCIVSVQQSSQPLPPVADAGQDQSVNTGTSVNFDASQSYDPDGSIVQYTWDFGDGTTATTTTPYTTHTYSTAGTYVVTLTVVDNSGLTDSDTCTVTVKQPQQMPGFEAIAFVFGVVMVVAIMEYYRRRQG